MGILLGTPRFWRCYQNRYLLIIVECNREIVKVFEHYEIDDFYDYLEDKSGSKLCVKQFKKYGKCEWCDL